MSPRQISFLTSHTEGAWSAQQQRHFEGKPFEAGVSSSMPFYGSTVGEAARLRASAEAKAAPPKIKIKHRPDALSFLDADSIASVHTSEAADSSSSQDTQPESDATSPETSESGDLDSGTTPKPASDLHMARSQSMSSSRSRSRSKSKSMPPQPSPVLCASNTRRYPNLHVPSTRPPKKYPYGTPEMPRGSANLPHRPVSVLNPRTAGHVKHLPRAEKLPLSGYELLAAQLSSHGHGQRHGHKKRRDSVVSACSDDSSACDAAAAAAAINIKPLYRKFESLNHRILLHLQDELSELEEQLHRLDTADTQTRRLQSHILPASRRAGASSGGELQWHKTDVLGKIGYKLGQYNHVLSSFTETQQLASPTLHDVGRYRAYLDTQQPIAEIETRFLDARDDLVMLAAKPAQAHAAPSSEASLSPYMPTMEPLFRCASPASVASDVSSALSERDGPVLRDGHVKSARTRPRPVQDSVVQLTVALAVAVVVPVLTFSMIPTFSGRIAVVLLVAFTVFSVQVQASEHAAATSRHQARDLVCCAAAYGAVMAVVANACAYV